MGRDAGLIEMGTNRDGDGDDNAGGGGVDTGLAPWAI
jgi:hypothetical protein